MSKYPLRKSACALAVLFFCLAFGFGHATAQTAATTGKIVGTVKDKNGAVVPNATVTVTSTETGVTQTVNTSEDGVFSAVNLKPGDYTLEVTAANFGKFTQTGYKVEVGSALDAQITLQVGAVTETVLITAGAGVETTMVQTPTNINQTSIEELPINGRRFTDFVRLTPTADIDPVRSQISLAGQRGINANVNIDGADYNNPFFGGYRGGERANEAFGFPQEAVREFQVVATGYNAEFGRSTGGIVNVVTKSGTNEMHGSAFVLLRPQSWAHRNAFGQKASPTQKQFGGSIGGPIKKDKLFYFFSVEQQLFHQSRAVLFDRLHNATDLPSTAVGVQEALSFFNTLEVPYTQTNNATALLGRVDYNFNQKNQFNARYNYSRNRAQNAVSAGASLQATVTNALSNNGTEGNGQHTFASQLTTFFNSTTVNELRVQYSREERPRIPNVIAPLITPAFATIGTVSFLPTTENDYRVQIADSLTYNRGAHSFKFGGDFNRTHAAQVFAFRQTGNLDFTGSGSGNSTSNVVEQLQILSLGSSGTGDPANRFDSPKTRLRQQIGNALAAMSSSEFALFGQDAWRIRPNFTLNYGLRYEAQFLFSPEANNTTLVDLVRNTPFPVIGGRTVDPTVIADQPKQFAPRLGFAWDPWKDGKTAIRGYSGIYYARTPMLTLAGPENNFRTPPGDVTVSIQGFTTASAAGTACANVNSAACPNTLYKQYLSVGINLNNFPLDKIPILTLDQFNQIRQNIAAARGQALNAFEGLQLITAGDQLRNPRSYQAGAAFEHELARGLTVGAMFDYVKTVHLNRNRDINLPLPTLRAGDLSQRPFFNTSNRPLAQFGTGGILRLRESSAKALYRAFTLRAQLRRKIGQFDAFYTLSKNTDDDSTERDATFIEADNTANFKPEYGPSRLDRRHQFVFNTVFNAPFGFQVSATGRFRSGTPIDVFVGNIIAPAGSGLTAAQYAQLVTLSGSTSGDSNGDGNFQDRPLVAPGVPGQRDRFRNRPTRNVDVRIQRNFKFGEKYVLSPSFEVFNLFKFKNIVFPQQDSLATTTIYGNPGVNEKTGEVLPASNPNFFRIKDASNNYLTGNNPGPPLAMQIGLRFRF
jgi:outer membrane receptor for ferrienterochelin and colicin